MTDQGTRVLVVDDELAIRRFLRTSLTANGYTVFEASNAEEALRGVAIHRPDLLILDLGLPDFNGLEVVKQLREWTQLPIIILSVHDQESEKISALDAGADDYLTKPFSIGELMARIRAAMRHVVEPSEESVFMTGGLTVDRPRRIVKVDGQEIQLTPIEYDLLRVLVAHAGKVLTHHHLLREVWGRGYEEEAHLLRVHISNLRGKIEAEPARPHYILTEPGVGYRLQVIEPITS